ncbi:(Fe-S)-binding protein [Desulfofundulus thermobenzoicus]|uniref:(Fe-S)-binding protein n=1 Tax=Desulfofundulus thermobenzoicus TaxID=29376 RepID=A0A6N7IPJ7_9FIRM|nr:(Fe-S)-binding protein [Desulfofundulus thermobenzoicus]MQL51509.1 (Fe-S)-binding protein [Desulfofundulus thermobenzoicus]HHW44505.1 (Fe-S)-binding protein [Desulfotomaculum sp.]
MCAVAAQKVFDDYRVLSDEALKPGEPRVEKFLQAMRKSLQQKENWTFWLPYILSLDTCMKCGTCAGVCPVYQASGRREIYHPVFRTDMLRKVYKRYFTLPGRLFPSLVGAEDLTEEKLNALAENIYRCTICRRCSYVCPVAVDNGVIVREARKILDACDIAPDELKERGTRLQVRVGNATGMSTPAFKDMIEFLEDEIEESRGYRVTIPVDKEGAEYLLMNNAGDYLAFVETVMGVAEVLTAAGVNWTLNSPDTGINDAVNYGVFYSDAEFARVIRAQVETARKMGIKTLVIGECGHAFEALKYLILRFIPPAERPFEVKSILELEDEWLREGRIKVDPQKNTEPVTFHDSCKYGRLGGMYEEPRRILKACCTDFREMSPNREMNLCCGGGSGFAIMEKGGFLEFRMETYGKLKARQLEATGAKIVACACSNCKAQFREIIKYHKLPMRYAGVSELLANALVR